MFESTKDTPSKIVERVTGENYDRIVSLILPQGWDATITCKCHPEGGSAGSGNIPLPKIINSPIVNFTAGQPAKKDESELDFTQRAYENIWGWKEESQWPLHSLYDHIIYQPKLKVGNDMKKYSMPGRSRYFSGLPLLELEEVRKAWVTLIETSTARAFFSFLSTILVLLFGAFTVLHWALLLIASLHFIARHIANKYRNAEDYIHFSRSIQLFIWPFLWLAVGNALNYIISINGFPPGTLVTIVEGWLIWGELKGIVENAKLAGIPVPPIFESIVHRGKDYVDPPLG